MFFSFTCYLNSFIAWTSRTGALNCVRTLTPNPGRRRRDSAERTCRSLLAAACKCERLFFKMGRLRQRFNEKGRQSGIQKMLNLKRARLPRSIRIQQNEETKDVVASNVSSETSQTKDPNAEIIVPESEQQRNERRKQLREQLLQENQDTMSSKKRKRLEKYIENKLKKERTNELIKIVAEEKVDTALLLSSKNFGKKQTAKERLQRSFLEEKNGLPISDPDSKLVRYVERPTSNPFLSDAAAAGSSQQNAIQPSKANENKKLFGFGFTADASTESGNGLVVRPKKKKVMVQRLKNLRNAEYDSDEEDYMSTDEEESESENEGSDAVDEEEEQTKQDDAVSETSEESEAEEDSSENEETADTTEEDTKQRAEKFKQWATKQMVGETESTEVTIDPKKEATFEASKKAYLKKVEQRREIDAEVDVVAASRTTRFVIVDRSEEVQQSRLSLPIMNEEQHIMETVFLNDVVIICGSTGSGKTTQVPQFLFEAGFGLADSDTPGMIGVTQPRRVAAVSLAKRVAEEMGNMASKVAHQIRFDSTVSPETAVKFMTDGVLLRELASDFLLTKYSAIVVDEAHERSINTDILLGLLSRIVKLRREMHLSDENVKPLKLIIMSATLRVSDFAENTQLFKIPPPIIEIGSRQYPVSIHFNRVTQENYLEDAFNRVCKIHKTMPSGAILVFLTGQQEVEHLCKLLRKRFVKNAKDKERKIPIRAARNEVSLENEDIQSDGEDEEYIKTEDEDSIKFDASAEPLHILPLYSLLTTEEQLRVFQKPPEGSRMCVVATNVAETSLTIPNVRYVVDCGKAKERVTDRITGVQRYEVQWISKANAEQRTGRAGRTGPGHCYRLFSSAVYDRSFPLHNLPEILRAPIEGIVLQMKSMNIDNVVNFPFPTAPDRVSLQKATHLLQNLGALDASGKLTKLGENMSLFPLPPRSSKMLVIGQQHACLPFVIALVSALTIGQIFVSRHALQYNSADAGANETEDDGDESNDEKSKHKDALRRYYQVIDKFSTLEPNAPVMRLLSAVCAFDFAKDKWSFCRENFLRQKALEEVTNLRKHIINILKRYVSTSSSDYTRLQLKPPSKLQVKALEQIVAAAYIDQLARYERLKKAYVTLFPCGAESVTFHPESNLKTEPEYVVYSALHQSASGRTYIQPLVPIAAQHISRLAPKTSLLSYSKPLSYPPIRMLNATTRECWVLPLIGSNTGSGNASWELPAEKITQKRQDGRWVNC
ncbi:ATP-dependent RNA helicase Dhr1 [Schizosaccharomyces japonicus yFS275]|uniref:RNA helicase n=1 Tax=Schizosaccharomyces japonicus (strain yFS275 / FY16936) TaxID=402676 RepID=B6K394_SCHJY|nr:ATP-dependent RNA helicase Dhr1 [Schizosaccharomyces japonicus yFS275]EEB07951.1 ATP-dependent RNA helicase Dhr1 [Schizosaccharomyces japonicus yFS275]